MFSPLEHPLLFGYSLPRCTCSFNYKYTITVHHYILTRLYTLLCVFDYFLRLI